MSRNKTPVYLISVLLFMLVLPVISITAELLIHPSIFNWALTGKWFVFWAVGVRLFIAGARQVTKPAFTAREIFHITSEDSLVIVRELGLANISMGLLGIASLYKNSWCTAAAFAGGLYFGFAGLMHVFKKPDSTNEVIAMISDLYIFVLLLAYLIFTL